MSIKHSSVDIAKAVRYMSLEFRGKSWVKNIDMAVINFYVVWGGALGWMNLPRQEASIEKRREE